MNQHTPVFGERVAGASYVRRPSVYAVIKNEHGHVAVVRTAQGVFLPGGGIESDETPEQAALREVREECGLDIRLLSRLRDAVQLVYSQAEQTHFEKVSTFFAAVVEGHRSDPSEEDHELLWLESREAASLVSHESHRWALTAVISGGCLCAGIRYEVRGPFLRASYCHCSRCRRHSGAAASAQGRVSRSDFTLLSGAELIRVFEPSDGAVKAFCAVCGSSVFGGTWPEGPEVSIRLGTVDGDPGIRPQYHTYVGSKAVWADILDGLPQYVGPKTG